MASTIINGTTLADPAAGREGYRRTEIDVGASNEMADGSIVYDYVGARYRHLLNWIGISEANRDTIRARYAECKTATRTFQSPDGDNHTVLAVPNSWQEDFVSFDGGTTRYWYITLQLEDSS